VDILCLCQLPQTACAILASSQDWQDAVIVAKVADLTAAAAAAAASRHDINTPDSAPAATWTQLFGGLDASGLDACPHHHEQRVLRAWASNLERAHRLDEAVEVCVCLCLCVL